MPDPSFLQKLLSSLLPREPEPNVPAGYDPKTGAIWEAPHYDPQRGKENPLGAIGRLLYDALSHDETAPGLRPQDDESVRLLKQALKAGGASAKIVQAALRSPKTTEMSTGDPSLLSLLGLHNYISNLQGSAIAGTTRGTKRGSKVGIYPKQAEMMDAKLPTDTVPHELLHAMRFNKGLLSGNTNIEEALARVGSDRPMTTWADRQFEDEPQLLNFYRKQNKPMRVEDLNMLQEIVARTLK